MLPRALLCASPIASVQEFLGGSIPPAFLGTPKLFSEMVEWTLCAPNYIFNFFFFTSLTLETFEQRTDQIKSCVEEDQFGSDESGQGEKPLAR